MKKTIFAILLITLILTGCVNESTNENMTSLEVEKDTNEIIQNKVDDYTSLSEKINNTNNNEKTYIESIDKHSLIIEQFAYDTTSYNKTKKINKLGNDCELQIERYIRINGDENTSSIYYDDAYSYMEVLGTKMKTPVSDINEFEITFLYKPFNISKSNIMQLKLLEEEEVITYSYSADAKYMEGVLEKYLIQNVKSMLYSDFMEDTSILDTARLDLMDVNINTMTVGDYVFSQKIDLKGFVLINDHPMKLTTSIEMTYAPLNDDFIITKPNLDDYIELK